MEEAASHRPSPQDGSGSPSTAAQPTNSATSSLFDFIYPHRAWRSTRGSGGGDSVKLIRDIVICGTTPAERLHLLDQPARNARKNGADLPPKRRFMCFKKRLKQNRLRMEVKSIEHFWGFIHFFYFFPPPFSTAASVHLRGGWMRTMHVGRCEIPHTTTNTKCYVRAIIMLVVDGRQ